MKKNTLLILLATILVSMAEAAQKPKYIFYFIGDGMGHNHIALTEATMMNSSGALGYQPLGFTKFPAVGFITTYAANRQITCSAAAGTALATGSKTSINTIGMNTDRTANLYSTAVAAQKHGMKVGITTSVSIDHATPAAFYAHAEDRNNNYKIAECLTQTGFDLYASGGLLKPTEGRSIYEILSENGYTTFRGSGQTLTGSKVYWEQSSEYKSDALPLAIDSQKGDLTLSEITEKSIKFLDNKKGFFLMVEGGQIDWAAHANDAASIVHETYDFAKAVDVALEFYKRHPQETLIIVTADHETGGLALGLGERGYNSNFELLLAQKMSRGHLESAMKSTKNWDEAKQLLADNMGFWGKVTITLREELELMVAYESSPEKAATQAIKLLNKKAGVGFTTGAHTAAFVPVFAIGASSEMFNGRADNTDIPKKITKLIEAKK